MKYATLSEDQLERLLWHQILRNPHLFIDKKFIKNKGPGMENVKFDAIEKNPRAPKIVSKINQSKLRLEKELAERNKPNVFTYSPDDRKIKNRLPLFTFAKGPRGDRTPSLDRQKPLNVDITLTKKTIRKVAILPEHNVTENQMLKEVEQTRLGPATYKLTFGLVEPRADKGVPKIVRPPTPKEKEQTE